MAYDGISLATKQDLSGNHLLDPIAGLNTNTGELLKKSPQSRYGSLTIKHGQVYNSIKGSIHEHHHGNNGVDFTFAEFVDASIKLFTELELNPFEVMVRSFEFGVNIELPIEIDLYKFMRHCKTFNGKPINAKLYRDTKALFIEIELDNYKLKLYQKGVQLQNVVKGINPNLMRAELKVKRMAYCKDVGVTTNSPFADLINPLKAFQLNKLLRQEFDKVVFYDWTINPKQMTRPERRIFKNWKDPVYIETLATNDKRKYKHERQMFDRISKQYAGDDIKENVWNLIENKWSEIWQLDAKTCTKIHAFFNQYENIKLSDFTSSILGVKEYNILTPDAIEYLEQIQGVKRCIVTGGDIADQKAGSKFISAKKIGYYDAHNIRNTDSNPRNNLRRSIERIANDPSLFPIDSILTITDDQKKILEYWQGTQYDVLKNVGVSN